MFLVTERISLILAMVLAASAVVMSSDAAWQRDSQAYIDQVFAPTIADLGTIVGPMTAARP